jgi:hypothetical protein
VFVDNAADFRLFTREPDLSLLIEDADPLDTAFLSHVANGLVQSLSVVAQHLIASAAHDQIADPLRARQNEFFGILPPEPVLQKRKHREDGGGAQDETHGQLRGYAKFEGRS